MGHTLGHIARKGALNIQIKCLQNSLSPLLGQLLTPPQLMVDCLRILWVSEALAREAAVWAC